jgi:alpha-maltose-1-phosphate synthase
MLKVLSVQSDALGHRTYCNSLRACLAGHTDIELTAYWSSEERSIATRLITKGASLSLPWIAQSGNNLDFRRARAEWAYGRMSRMLTKRKLSENQYDMLHLHTQIQAFGSAEVMKTIPTVVSIDMTACQVAREPMVTHPRTFAPNIEMESKVFHAAAHIVTWSDWARQSVIEDHGVPEDKVTTIPPGARLEYFPEPSFESRQKPRILFVGGDFSRKGGWDLLEVFAAKFQNCAELHLVTNQHIPVLPRNAFLYRNVAAYTPQWHDLFSNAEILVLPSYAEAFGLVLQEGAGHGLALVGTQVGGIPEIIIEGENGFLIQPGNKSQLTESLAALIENRNLLKRMRQRSRALAASNYHAATNFRKLTDLFLSLANVSVSRLRCETFRKPKAHLVS